MKRKTPVYSALALSTVLFFTACSEETSTETTVVDSSATLTAPGASATPAMSDSGMTMNGSSDMGSNSGTDMNATTAPGTVRNGEENTTGTQSERVWDEAKGEWKEVRSDTKEGYKDARSGVKGAYKEGKQETKELVNDGGKGD